MKWDNLFCYILKTIIDPKYLKPVISVVTPIMLRT